MMVKKSFFKTFLIFSFVLSSCQVQWFEDIKTELESNSSSEYKFYSQKEESGVEPVIESYTVKIGTDFDLQNVSTENYDSLIAGYHVGGWKYYRTPGKAENEIVSTIYYNDDSTIKTVSVTPEQLDFLASWKPNTDTKYTVKHFFQNLDLETYDLDEEKTQTMQGTTDTQTSAAPHKIKGFTPREFTQANINGDGSGLVEIYYDRAKISIKVYIADGRSDDGLDFTGYFGQQVADLQLPDRIAEAMVFDGWKVTLENGSEEDLEEQDITYSDDKAVYTAKWKVIPAEGNVTVTYPAAESDVDLTFHLETPVILSRLPVGGGIIFSIKCNDAPSGYTSYTWIIDGDLPNRETGQILDASVLLTYGYHSVMLVVTDNAGNQYSKEAIIHVKEE